MVGAAVIGAGNCGGKLAALGDVAVKCIRRLDEEGALPARLAICGATYEELESKTPAG